MKKCLVLSLLLVLLLSFCACSAKQENTYLPSRIEQISAGGVVPEKDAAKQIMEPGKLPIESFWGTWVPKGSSADSYQLPNVTFKLRIPEAPESEKTVAVETNCFPESFELFPSYHSAFSFSMNDSDPAELAREPLGVAFENQNLGFGSVQLQFNPKDTTQSIAVITQMWHAICYAVGENTLAIGITDTTSSFGNFEEKEETAIVELDYTFTWNGTELSLTYEGNTVTYVPQCVEDNSGWNLSNAAPINDDSSIHEIRGINITKDKQQLLYDVHAGYEDAKMNFNADGNVTIDDKIYQYLYSGSSLTLCEGDNVVVYSNYEKQKESSNFSMTTSFLADDNIIVYNGLQEVQNFLDKGFKTNISTSQLIAPFAVTDEFDLDYNGAKLHVKANNPYEDAVPLKNCIVCYIMIDDKTGTLSKGSAMEDSMIVGKTTYDYFDMTFDVPYEKTENRILYKSRYPGVIYMADVSALGSMRPKLDLYQNLDVIFEFEDRILQKVIIQAPALLYNGLQDNIEDDELINMSAAQMQVSMSVRDKILNKLKQEFANAGVDVHIDPISGEIDFDTSVLFQYNSDEFSDGSSEYIDSFMKVYAAVILDEDMKDIITEVRFEGHTDSDGSYAHNIDLSQRRADAVLNYCLRSSSTNMNRTQKERLQSKSTTIGRAYTDLVYNEDGTENKVASRRVSVKFFISTSATDVPENFSAQTDTPPTSTLNANDFIAIDNGEEVDILDRMIAENVMLTVSYPLDGSFETNRGIQLGDSVNTVLEAYGQCELLQLNPIDVSGITNSEGRNIADDCKTYLYYQYAEEAAILFCLDDWNCVSWICYTLI